MLWKTLQPECDGNGMSSSSTSELNGSLKRNGDHQASSSSSCKRRRCGAVIFPFQPVSSSDHFLPLELGDCVIILSEPSPGWFYGYKKYFPEVKGLFPLSFVSERKRTYSDLLEKIGEVCKEWGEIRKKLFVDCHQYQFDAVGRGLFELIEGRRALLNQSLTQDQVREVTRKLCTRIDWGNRKLGLDLIPWSFLVEETTEDVLKVLPDCNKDAGKLFQLHQSSVESGATRGSSTLNTRAKGKGGGMMKNNDLYVALRDFSYIFTDDCEISFCLFDGKKFISERYTMNQQHAQARQSNFHVGVDDRPTVFKEVNVGNKRDLYLVVQIVRIGRMFYTESSNKKLTAAKKRFRRPYACGVLSLADIETVNEPEEMELTMGCGGEKTIKLYNSDEKDFWQVHELIVSQNYKNIVSKIIPVLNSFSVSVFWCGAHTFSANSHNMNQTRLIGVNNLIAPPGVVRNDLYLTLSSVELLDKKQNKTGGAKSCNLEVEIQVIDDEDDLLNLEGNCWKSLILYHVNNPKYNEMIKFSIPIEVFPRAKLRCIFRHCSAKDKTDKKMFGITWLSLMDPSGTTVRDGDRPLQIYKWTDESSLPVQSCSLNLSKDTVNLHTLMISTKFTQNMDLVNLLKWKQTVNLKPSLQNLISGHEATEEIVRKFLQDVLDALFTIFSDEDGNSTDYSGDVFTLLVNIFQLLRNPSYSAYRTVLDAYCNEQFAAALVYKGLLLSLRHYTTVLLNSVTEDITQSIQNCYGSLQFIFKFAVQSQMLFAKATGGQLEDSFRRDVKALISAFCQVFGCTDCSPVFVETQSILLQNFHAVYEELLRVMPMMDVCQLVCEIFRSIPVKDTAAHPLSPAKLSAIHQVVKSSIFRHSACRAILLPVFCKHIRHHLAHREELKLCTDVLSEILIYLYTIRNMKEEKAHADIEVVCTTTLEMLVQSVLVLERTSSIVGNLVTCLISLLEQMNHCHFNRLWDEFHERKPLRDLLLRVFLLFRDLIKHEVFPTDWAFMKLLTNHVMLTSLQEFCQPLVTDFLKFFDVQLWAQYFTLAVTFISQPGLQLEDFREWKKEWILEKYGDMRLAMGYQMLQLWTHLGDDEKRNFIPSMIGPFLEVTMIPQEELRLVTLQRFFYDMMQTEFRLNGNIKDTETELIDRLDLLINSGESGTQHGDDEYRIKFRELHLQRLESESNKKEQKINNNWFNICSTSIDSLANLQQLLLDYREIAKNSTEGNRDKLMQCTVNLLNFYREEKRLEQYLRYVYKLHDLHLSCENYTEAGFTLLLHGQLLQWNREKMLPETYETCGMKYPRQREAERKELIYLRVLDYFDQGKLWEKGITLCKELADLYEKRYDYTKLSRILKTQATFYENILSQHRPEPEYFRVAFFGQGFPLFVRNKEFVYRGQEYERLAAFIQRIAQEWPQAELRQKNAPDPKLLESCGQHIQICSVKPRPSSMDYSVPEKIRAFYGVNDVSCFQYDRKIEKAGVVDDVNNEFKSMWIERTALKTGVPLPGTLRWAEIVEKKTVELSPIEFACEKMDEANDQLHSLVKQYAAEDADTKNVNPLSMRLQGMLDAAVMGGIPKYTEAFFNEEFLKQEQYSNFVLKLIGLLQDQVKLLEEGLDIHGRLIPPGVQPLHKRLLECHLQMKTSVSETEQMVISTLSVLNPSTLRRSESGNNIVRESFRRGVSSKSIVNSPLPPVPSNTPKAKLEHKLSNSNRSSTSSIGYGHMRVGASARDHLHDDDYEDDMYTQLESEQKKNSNGTTVVDGVSQAPTPPQSVTKPPLIPTRLKKTVSSSSTATTDNTTEYIFMPPSRIREIADGNHQGSVSASSEIVPTPSLPPKPRASSLGPSSSPPPLLPRKPAALPPDSKTSSNASLHSDPALQDPPPVPPKPGNANSVSSTENSTTYMNKAELLAEMDTINSNKSSPTTTLERSSTPTRRSGHKEYFVPPAVKDRNTTASN